MLRHDKHMKNYPQPSNQTKTQTKPTPNTPLLNNNTSHHNNKPQTHSIAHHR